jgi:hypothetical protein
MTLTRPRRLRSPAPIAAFVIALAVARPAAANDPAAAQVLFDQGRKLMAAERWSEACPKLEESQRLDPAGGTLLHLALCREREGKIATAWAIYQDALAQAKRDGRKDRAKIAQERIDALGPRLPRLRVAVARPNRAVRGFTVTRDDAAVGPAQWNDAIPIDPGPHRIKAQADGRKAWSTDVDVPAGAREISVEVPELEVDPRAVEKPGPAAPTRIEEATRGDGQRTLAIATGAVGIVGLGLGTVFGIVSKTKHDEADRECQPPDRKLCTAAGVDAGNAAQSAGTTATVAFVVGAVLVAGGAALYFTAPSGVAVAPTAAPGGGGVMIAGRFR